jgi:rare lipoprotein A
MDHLRENHAHAEDQRRSKPVEPAAAAIRHHRIASDALEHRGILLALLVTVVALPLLLIGRMSTATAMPRTVQVSSVAGPTTVGHNTTPPPVVVTPVGLTTTTSTTQAPAPPTTAPAPTTTAPAPTTTVARQAPATTAPRRVAPPTTVAPLRAPAPAPAPSHSQSGGGTWYKFKPGTCAHRTLPFGTVVHITDTANGKTASCVVADRGPFAAGRILDMDPSVFQQLAPLSAGVIPIVISW